MKSFLLIFLFFINAVAFCQFTEVPDPNFESFLEDNGMGDGIPNNGLIGVTDLTGIEGFSALEFLDFSYNQVNAIDLSQNLNLKLLGCAFNQLVNLDLTQNTQLEWVACMSNLSLTTISLNSEYLHTLEVHENSLY